MNNLFLILFLLFVGSGYGQIKFSEENTGFSSESVLLEFDDNEKNQKGLILPSVKSNDYNSVDGTLIFDTKDNNIKAKIEGDWISLTDKNPEIEIVINFEDNHFEDLGSGVFIGDNEEKDELEISGALILSSMDKAMVLPKIFEPHLIVVKPYPGFICYDTASNMLALFDGALWHYWK